MFATLIRLGRIVVPVVAAIVACQLLPPWFHTWYTGLASSTRRGLVLGFLRGLLTAYAVAWLGGVAALVVSSRRLWVGRRIRQSRPWSARILALSLSVLLGLVFLDAAGWWMSRRQVIAAGTFPRPPKAKLHSKFKDGGRDGPIKLLVIGESSAVGEPYQFWLSIGDIAAWQATKSHPERPVQVIMKAHGGASVSSMAWVLREQQERPDAVLLYCGHNEFQSRCPWDRTISYYEEDWVKPPPQTIFDRVGDWTPFCGLVRDLSIQQRLDYKAPSRPTRNLVDRPCCSAEEYDRFLREFTVTLESIVVWCEQAGAVPIFYLPAGNEAGFEPNRSVLDPKTPASERERFAQRFKQARSLEAKAPDDAIALYRGLLESQPGFAETHFRLARLLQARGAVDEARTQYTQARDLDGLPLRCPTRFLDVYREIARRHPKIVLIDAKTTIEARSPTKILDDSMFHDGQHPNLHGYAALAEALLNEPRARAALGMTPGTTPPINLAECVTHFGMTTQRWVDVCFRTYTFWERVAYIRHDPTERLRKIQSYFEAIQLLPTGRPPESLGIPGLGVSEAPGG